MLKINTKLFGVFFIVCYNKYRLFKAMVGVKTCNSQP